MKKITSSPLRWGIVLSFVVFVGLQLVSLNRWSVWHDESFTAMLLEYDMSELVRRAALDVHPPLYYIALKGWSSVFGDSMVALRLMSVALMASVFGLSLWMVRRLAPRAALWYALPVFALAPALVRYGQEMRMYALAASLALLSTHILLSIVERRFGRNEYSAPGRWRFILYTLCVAGVLYAHYFAGLILAVHWLLVAGEIYAQHKAIKPALKQLWFKERWWLYVNIGVIGLFTLWLPMLWRQFTAVEQGFWIGPVSSSSFLSTLSGFVIFRPEWLEWRLVHWYAAVMFLVAIIVGYFCYVIGRSVNIMFRAKVLLIGYWLVPMVILFVLSLPPLNPYYYDRYFVTFAPMFYALLPIGLYTALKEGKIPLRYRYGMGVFLLGCLLFGAAQTQIHGNNFGHRSDDHFTMQTIAEKLDGVVVSGDALIADGLWTYFDLRAYLKDDFTVQVYGPDGFNPYGNGSLVYDREDLIVKDFNTIQPSTRQVWLVAESGRNVPDIVPSNWSLQDSLIQYGYARVYRFVVQ